MDIVGTMYTGEYSGALEGCAHVAKAIPYVHWDFLVVDYFPEDQQQAAYELMAEDIKRHCGVDIDAEAMYVVRLFGSDQHVRDCLDLFAQSIRADYTGPEFYCGDDQHYDYLPDAMSCLRMLCQQAKLPATYELTRSTLIEAHFGADDEVQLPEWREL
jgi:hypothetical protein